VRLSFLFFTFGARDVLSYHRDFSSLLPSNVCECDSHTQMSKQEIEKHE
jgi:hypothetical protein